MINKDANQAVTNLALSLTSLGTSLITSRAIFPVVAGAATLFIHLIEKPRGCVTTDFARRLGGFSILTLGNIYFFVILFDPWQATFGTGRISTPLLEQAFVWLLIAFAASSSYGRIARAVTRTVLVMALLAGLDSRASAWYSLKDEETSHAYTEIERLVSAAAPGRRAHVCFAGGDYFRVLEDIVAPTLYASLESLPVGSIPKRCDTLLVHSAAHLQPPDSLAEAGKYVIRGTGYTLYLRRR
jgi:hypothetical protein